MTPIANIFSSCVSQDIIDVTNLSQHICTKSAHITIYKRKYLTFFHLQLKAVIGYKVINSYIIIKIIYAFWWLNLFFYIQFYKLDVIIAYQWPKSSEKGVAFSK